VSERGKVHRGISGSVFIQVLKGRWGGSWDPQLGGWNPELFLLHPGLRANKSGGTGRVEALLQERMAQGSFFLKPPHPWNPSLLSK